MFVPLTTTTKSFIVVVVVVVIVREHPGSTEFSQGHNIARATLNRPSELSKGNIHTVLVKF